MAQSPRLSVGFVLARDFTLGAFANFVDVLRLAADEGDRSRPIRCRWAVLSDTMEPIRASCGTQVLPTERLGEPGRFDYIIVVGGLIDALPRLSSSVGRFLGAAAAGGVALGGLCTGAFVLHSHGLMQGYRCCVSWFHHRDFLDRFDGLTPVSDQIFIVDRDRLTCSGGVNAAHLAAFLVSRHIGAAEAAKALDIMLIDGAAGPESPQVATPSPFATDDPLVRKALLLMRDRLAVSSVIDDIAMHLKVARRTLERRFHAALGLAPAAALATLRIEQARFLLNTTGHSMTEIALECGYCDGAHFSRMFKAHTGEPPSAARRRRASV